MTYYGDTTNPFTVCFTSMKIRYSEYDKSIDSLNFVNQSDKINVFINFESVLNNLSTIKDIENKLLLERKFPTILESEALNLCAHYKRFFRDNGLETRVFLYYTDLNSDEFDNFKYNEEFRSYYINKYLWNPKFQLLGNKMVSSIIPSIQKISEFIPNVYFIDGKGIEGSLIPYIIGKSDPSYKNFIISGDKYETQYQLYPKEYCHHYIKKSPMGTQIICTFDKYVQDLFKDNLESSDGWSELLRNPSFYSTLLSAVGDKPRSIEPLKGIGLKTIVKMIRNGINDGIITNDISSVDLIKDILPEDVKEFAVNNFNCINLEKQYGNLSQQQLFDIQNQIVNRHDFNSLLQLNNTKYADYPLMLNELVK